MPHPKDLLDKISSLLRMEYPEEWYRYEYEVGLPSNPAMRPDILIFDRFDDLLCVVEIGYTRPEKLTRYRALGIADVRWYDKEGNLHSGIAMVTPEPVTHNCSVKVYPVTKRKAELFVPYPLLKYLRVEEGERLVTIWNDNFSLARMERHPRGRKIERRKAVAGGPLVGQARVRLKPLGEPPLFYPVHDLKASISVGSDDHLVLNLEHPLRLASAKTVKALKERLQ